MVMVIIEVPDKFSELVVQSGNRLPELLAQNLREPTLLAHVYRHEFDFLACRSSPDQLAAFGPTSEMLGR